jgi:hypothetical protein
MTHGKDSAPAWDEHCNKALHRDGIKAQLLNKIISPKIDQANMKAVMGARNSDPHTSILSSGQ